MIFVGKSEVKDHLGELGIDVTIILRAIVSNQGLD